MQTFATCLLLLVTVALASPVHAVYCHEFGWDYSSNEIDQGCYVYCIFGDDIIEIYCPYAWYTKNNYNFVCGDENDYCSTDCVDHTFYDYYEIVCNCTMLCPMGYELVQKRKYNTGPPETCSVCPDAISH